MTQGEDILRAILELTNRHDADAIQAYLAEDMRFRNPITGESDASGMHAVHSALFAGVPATGKAINLPVAFCVDIAGGKVRDWRSYFDTASLMRQLGALPSPAEA